MSCARLAAAAAAQPAVSARPLVCSCSHRRSMPSKWARPTTPTTRPSSRSSACVMISSRSSAAVFKAKRGQMGLDATQNQASSACVMISSRSSAAAWKANKPAAQMGLGTAENQGSSDTKAAAPEEAWPPAQKSQRAPLQGSDQSLPAASPPISALASPGLTARMYSHMSRTSRRLFMPSTS